MQAFAVANLHYLLQVGWYILCGALGIASPYVSFSDLRWARKAATSDAVVEPTEEIRRKLASAAHRSDDPASREHQPENDAMAPR